MSLQTEGKAFQKCAWGYEHNHKPWDKGYCPCRSLTAFLKLLKLSNRWNNVRTRSRLELESALATHWGKEPLHTTVMKALSRVAEALSRVAELPSELRHHVFSFLPVYARLPYLQLVTLVQCDVRKRDKPKLLVALQSKDRLMQDLRRYVRSAILHARMKENYLNTWSGAQRDPKLLEEKVKGAMSQYSPLLLPSTIVKMFPGYSRTVPYPLLPMRLDPLRHLSTRLYTPLPAEEGRRGFERIMRLRADDRVEDGACEAIVSCRGESSSPASSSTSWRVKPDFSSSRSLRGKFHKMKNHRKHRRRIFSRRGFGRR